MYREGRWLYATFEGKTQTLAQWSREKGIAYLQVWSRIYRHGWSLEQALTTPLQDQPPRLHGTADMVRRTGCTCPECNQWRKAARQALKNNEPFIVSKAPHPDDQGRWFDQGRQRFILYRRQRLNIRQWAEKLGFVEITLRKRLLELKMPVKEAFNTRTKPHGQGIVHGTRTGYDYWKCRCEECKRANAAYSREYAATRPRVRSRKKAQG